MSHQIRPVKTSSLMLSTENPRFDLVTGQREAIRVMLENQKEKIVNLAKDIVESGLNPADLPIVVPDEVDSKRFKVLEGNRRVVAVKILRQPDLIPSDKKALAKKIKDLNGKLTQSLDEIYCVVMETELEAEKWIDLKHTGENDGVGTVSWDGTAKERFRERRGRTSATLQVLEFVKKKGNLDEQTRKDLNSIAITNLGRLLGDPDVREHLGIEFEDGKVSATIPDAEVAKGLTKVVKDLVEKKINVNNIRSKADRADYLRTFKPEELPNKTLTTSVWNLVSPKDSSAEKPQMKSKPLSTSRRNLIPSSCVLQINQFRINAIYRELKKLNVNEFTNSAAVLLRVFIELSLDIFIQENKLNNVNSDSKLVKKLEAVTKYFDDNKILSKHDLQPVRTALASADELLSTPTLNAYVHNHQVQPKEDDLKITWDNLEAFIKKVWQ